jgi:hypothetical protein
MAHSRPIATRLVAATHGLEEFRPPISEAWLAERLARMPSYGVQDLLMTDDAVMGVWIAGDDFKDEAPDRSREMRVGYIADYGLAGERGVENLLGLLALHRRRAAERGLTHLIAYTSDVSPGSDRLQHEAAYNDELVIQGGFPEPDGVASRGIYTDPFYV